jgi:hypothetical protein
MPGKSETAQLFLHGLEGQQRRACLEVQPTREKMPRPHPKLQAVRRRKL